MSNELENRTRETSAPLYEGRGWLKLLGALGILQGLWLAASVVGILVAWLPIWIGVLLLQSGYAIEKAHLRGDQEALVRSLRKLKTCFALMGGVLLLFVIAVSVFLVAFLTGAFSGSRWLTP